MDEKLTAKEYLKQLEMIDLKINQDLELLYGKKSEAASMGSFDYSKDRVKTSPTGDGLCKKVSNYVILDEQINREIDAFADARNKIIGEIRRLKKADYVNILFKMYVQYKSIAQTAEEMHKSYGYIRRRHLEALDAFEKANDDMTYLT